jgi:hypothetical protein
VQPALQRVCIAAIGDTAGGSYWPKAALRPANRILTASRAMLPHGNQYASHVRCLAVPFYYESDPLLVARPEKLYARLAVGIRKLVHSDTLRGRGVSDV